MEADRSHATVKDVFRRYGGAFRAWAGTVLSTAQRRVMAAIVQCRTAALGGHVEQCDQCGHRRVGYNSCLMESARFWGARVSPRCPTRDILPIRRAIHSP